MARKAGGLAAIMSGQPVVVVKKRSVFWRLRYLTRQGGLHVGLILVCILYVHVGALFFMYYESPEEQRVYRKASKKFDSLRETFLKDVEKVKIEDSSDERRINESVSRLVDDYSKHLMKLFSNPVAGNMFDCLFYSKSNYTALWTTDSSLLFTATTIIPVGKNTYLFSDVNFCFFSEGYGYIAPLTSTGRIVLCIYAAFGIPLALVMMSDVGKFFADAFVKFFHENITAFMVVLLILLVAYSMIGGIAYSKVVGVPMIEGIYFSTITIFTIGYGDISPAVPVYVVIIFIVFGVALVTIAIDVVAANIIHHIHYMGRQVGKARVIADKMLSVSHIPFKYTIRVLYK
uniref:Ion channel n=1 Tax=Caenorhabditis tropicalis TaxID=1561998 RepID=A0A1I7TAW5_9PELO